ncbi:MAG: ribosome-recycling factor, partial [Candidatus Dormibacteria bacterium]
MDDTLGGVALSEAKDRMDRAVAHAQADLAVIRTGRAAPALVEKLKVEYFGSQVPLQQLAGFTVPEARLLVIHPYDKSSIKSIERAIQHSDLGLTPSNDGQVVRLVFPQLTAD